jgi:hypothetical protein
MIRMPQNYPSLDPSWRFADSENTEVITLKRILRGAMAVRLVTHDEDDATWQFLDGEHVFEDDAVLVCLGEMVQFDPSLGELADLPEGWYAWRTAASEPWQRAKGEGSVTTLP